MHHYQKDYPRPQLTRGADTWQNLNGAWDFTFDDEDKGLAQQWYLQLPPDKTQIIVPFTYETSLSGIGDETVHAIVFYQKTITIPPEKIQNGNVVLHFEGSDYETQVFVNGQAVGKHLGGYARFSFDITPVARIGENIVTVRVADYLDEAQPRGKQRWIQSNFGCWYVQTTGIWKSVWLEYLPKQSIKHLKITPLLREESVSIACQLTTKTAENLSLRFDVFFDGQPVTTQSLAIKKGDASVSLNLYNTDITEWGIQKWAPEHPHLYDVTVTLLDSDRPVDTVYSYFGMREIYIEGDQIYLNDNPLYQRLVLDQGYWADGHLTPPSEEALIEDIDKIFQLGYNGVRKHQKTEDERFLYWCDVKGLLVWSEMAAAYRFNDYAVSRFLPEWTEVVIQNYNHPCIITWTPINESWGVPNVKYNRQQQHFTEAIYHLTKSLDAYRPVIVNDGWEHTISDIITLHDYEEDGATFLNHYQDYKNTMLTNQLSHNRNKTVFASGFAYKGQPILLSEYGGIAYNNGESGWGYGNKVNSEEEFLARFEKITRAMQNLEGCCGYCYTQITDVQQEINGLLDPQRKPKVNISEIHRINTLKTRV